jgi:drug/metabolite transporter (DMT)-like permease
MLYAGIVVTAGGFVLYAIALRQYPLTAQIIFFLKPAVAPIFAWLLLNERITPVALIGMLIIVVGTVFSVVGNHQEADNLQHLAK